MDLASSLSPGTKVMAAHQTKVKVIECYYIMGIDN